MMAGVWLAAGLALFLAGYVTGRGLRSHEVEHETEAAYWRGVDDGRRAASRVAPSQN